MRTNIEIDDLLIQEAMKITQVSTKKEVVHLALSELVAIRRRRKMLDYKGNLQWVGNLDDMRETR